ncbi:tRNA isopentenyltransferase-like protein [Hortaea werneckii]|nr:tRNA isopentenyltransferase-like protein [Hortaea werneckii]
MASNPAHDPLIAVIGATGTGKSQLAVELARRYNGEVINGDAMQLYSGLPIITNKITTEEQRGIPHHLLGCIGLQEPTWVVGTFVKRAVKVIEEIRSRGKLPILVGGTHYYTQSLLFHDRLAETEGETEQDENAAQNNMQHFPVLEEPTEILLEELKRVDPAMAERWHPKDRRKIQRSLEIYLKTGKKASDTYAEQRMRKDEHRNEERPAEGDPSSSNLRFPTLLFWVHAEPEPLRSRLDSRVDKMLDAGLLDEVHTLDSHAEAEALAGRPVDETRGIWVSIGYKEFKPYTHALGSGNTSEKELARLKTEAVDRTKAATRQYAKRQIRWIRIKLVNALDEAKANDRLFVLDASDATQYDETVVKPALAITEQFLAGTPLPPPETVAPSALTDLLNSRRDYDISAKPETWTKQHCETCSVTCVVQDQWHQHINSKAHKKLVSKRRKQAADALQREGNPCTGSEG